MGSVSFGLRKTLEIRAANRALESAKNRTPVFPARGAHRTINRHRAGAVSSVIMQRVKQCRAKKTSCNTDFHKLQ